MSKWQLPEFAGKQVVFIGRGREGLSFERFIGEHGQIASFRFIDQKDDPDYLDRLRDIDLATTIVVKTAGCPGRLVPVPYTTPTNVFFGLARNTGATLVGVTGTKGKSTTSSLLNHILQTAGKKSVLCGNIGHPMIDFLDEASPETIFVLELGAYQTADLTHSPHIALVLNLFHEHLDYFGSIDAYFEAKHQLLAHMQASDTFVYNPDFPQLQTWARETPAKAVALDWTKAPDTPLHETRLMGAHNQKNIVAAQTVARLLGTDEAAVQSAPRSFTPLRHRLQVVARHGEITFVDDAISTTPESAIAAMEAVSAVGCMLLGGQDRGYDFSELGRTLAAHKVPALVLFPESGARIKASLPAGYQPAIFETRSMEDAVAFAVRHAPSGSAVLLSTASPSYGLWKDFEEKGDIFQMAVKSLS